MVSGPIPISSLISYLASSPIARSRVVTDLATRGEYSPGRDFWRGFRVGITNDRRTSRDGAAARAAANNAPPSRRSKYAHAADDWDAVLERWDQCAPITLGARVVMLGGLSVSVSPSYFEQRPDGAIEAVVVRLVNAELPEHVRRGVLRLLQRAYPEATPVLIDLPRQMAHEPDANLVQLDAWLESEAAGLAFLLEQAA